MSIHIEWARTTTAAAFIDEPAAVDFSDAHGNKIDPGNVALFIGGADGAIVEGTRQELADWLRDALALVDQPTGQQKACVVWSCDRAATRHIVDTNTGDNDFYCTPHGDDLLLVPRFTVVPA